jgi:uncharacterized protein YndB with AHSA1/START domain
LQEVAPPRKCAQYNAVTNYEITVDIDASPERIWDVMMDVEKWPEWTPSMTSLKRLDSGELREGSRVRIKQPKLAPATMTVTHLERDKTFTWETRAPGLVATATHTIIPRGSASAVVLKLVFDGLIGGILGRAMKNLNERYIAYEAAGLKKRSEHPPATARLR